MNGLQQKGKVSPGTRTVTKIKAEEKYPITKVTAVACLSIWGVPIWMYLTDVHLCDRRAGEIAWCETTLYFGALIVGGLLTACAQFMDMARSVAHQRRLHEEACSDERPPWLYLRPFSRTTLERGVVNSSYNYQAPRSYLHEHRPPAAVVRRVCRASHRLVIHWRSGLGLRARWIG